MVTYRKFIGSLSGVYREFIGSLSGVCGPFIGRFIGGRSDFIGVDRGFIGALLEIQVEVTGHRGRVRDTPRRSSVGGVVSKLDRHDEVGRAARQAARADILNNYDFLPFRSHN